VALHPGTRVGPYEITGTLGAGGMGEVYRARDTKLGRDVALKILPDQFAHDPDRLARFEREAVVLASLNHPNIGAIYGVEERALVLELAEGETLARARNGRELFYRLGNTLISVDISTSPTFSPSTPRRLFEGRYVTNVGRANYDVSADGRQFLMIEAVGSESRTTQLNLVQEWFEELKRAAGTR